jgi:hypothetical protein
MSKQRPVEELWPSASQRSKRPMRSRARARGRRAGSRRGTGPWRCRRSTAGLEAEGAAPDHVGDGGEAAPGHELDRGAHGVADRQPEQGAAGAAERVGVDGRRFRRRVAGPPGRCSPPTSPSGGPSSASSSAPHGSTSTSRRSRPDAPGAGASPFPARALAPGSRRRAVPASPPLPPRAVPSHERPLDPAPHPSTRPGAGRRCPLFFLMIGFYMLRT